MHGWRHHGGRGLRECWSEKRLTTQYARPGSKPSGARLETPGSLGQEDRALQGEGAPTL